MLKTYETPEVEIIQFEVADVITTSDSGPDLGGGGLPIV